MIIKNKWYASPNNAIKAFNLVKSVLSKIINNPENAFYVNLLQSTLNIISYFNSEFTLQFVAKTKDYIGYPYGMEIILKYPSYTDDSDKNYYYHADLIERCNYIYNLEVQQNDDINNKYDIVVYVY